MNANINGCPLSDRDRLTLEGRREDLQSLVHALQSTLNLHPSEGPFFVQVMPSRSPGARPPVQDCACQTEDTCAAEEGPMPPSAEDEAESHRQYVNSQEDLRAAVHVLRSRGLLRMSEHLPSGFGSYLLQNIYKGMQQTQERQRKEKMFLDALALASDEVGAEVIDARARFGEFASPHEAFAVLLEEVDELRRAVFSEDRSAASIRKELRSVAAMALSFMAVSAVKSGEQFGE